ncbi:S8 family serine peptidase [Nonomuraea sp. NPDC050643]|uniref:S8 family serine peptidase n=1 Tax=Nonomuraea sp. NPDC050643 TaxID=3155660 RepID=UPI0033DA7968
MRRPDRRWVAVAAALTVSVTPMTGARADDVPGLVPAQEQRSYDVTLVTGDKVHVTVGRNGRQQASVTPRGGDPARSGFRVVEHGGQLSVLPADVAALVPERLDPELFNVTSLAAQGYTDQQTDSLPLIVKYGAAAPVPLAGTTAVNRLASIGAAGVKLAKKDAAAFAAGLLTPAGLTAGVTKVWLDRKVTARRDTAEVKSAVAAGTATSAYDGAGTTVAVLDSGIDATHPDLTGKVTAAHDFTWEADPADHFGSGTAMAGVIAGTGAASGGAYKGVAPGAKLLNGKILDSGGAGLASWAIQGMEWASQQADVVTMAVSVPGQGGPLTEAVNELTARNGTLFVITSGDRGCQVCVESPADAPAALTVGAVDAAGALADFSVSGPVGFNRAVKPELTALGVGVVAGRARDTQVAEPVGDHYGRYSGTALAASQAAGAAALLRQASPGISAPELKSALAGSSEALPGVPVDKGGAGRLDIAGALARTVLADAGPLDFGLSTVGTGDPVTRTVTYRNPGKTPITLALDTRPPFMLSASELTLPAGGKGQVSVTLDPAKAAAGWVRAELVATPAGGARLRTLLTGNVEVQRVKLRVSAVARDGRPSRSLPSVINLDNGGLFGKELPADADRKCETGSGYCWLVPPGTYSVLGLINTMRPGYDPADYLGRGDVLNQSFVGNPQLEVARDTDVVLDARKAVPVRIDTPDHDTKRNRGAATKLIYTRAPADGPRYTESFLEDGRLEESFYLQPTAKVTKGEFSVATRWRLEAPAITMRAPGVDLDPEYPDAVFFSNRSTQFPRLDGAANLQVVDAGDGSAAALAGRDVRGKLALVRRTPGVPVSAQANPAAAAGARMVAVHGDPRLEWNETKLNAPTVMLTEREGAELAGLLRSGPVTVVTRGVTASPYVYDLYLSEDGRIRDDPSYTVTTRSLARVDMAFHGQGGEDALSGALSEAKYGWMPWESTSWDVVRPVPGGPRVRADYLSPAPGVRWSVSADMPERPYNLLLPEEEQGVVSVADDARGYPAGARTGRTWFKQPVAAGFPADSPTTRQGDVLTVDMRAFVDGGGNVGSAPSDPFEHGVKSDWRIYKGAELLARTEVGGSGRVWLPQERASYRVEYAVENRSTWARLSTRTRTVWTFDSERVEGDPVALPLLAVSYDAPVDVANQAASTRLGLTVAHQPGAKGSAIGNVSLETSADDGRTWRPALRVRAMGGGLYDALIERPASGVVSLRVKASDAAGSTVTQEVIRAYGTSVGGR